MTDHDALAALLDAMEKSVADHEHDVAGRMVPCDLRATWNELRHAAGVRVTGDAGLRDRLLMAVGPVIGDHIGGDYPEVPMTVLYRFQSALVDAVLAALTGDTPEAHP